MAELTRSFAPRFRNRAPAKNRDLLAMIVMYTVLPYIERAVELVSTYSKMICAAPYRLDPCSHGLLEDTSHRCSSVPL